MPTNYSSSKIKRFKCPIVLLLSVIILHPPPIFFQRYNSHDPSSMQANTILRRELQEVYYVVKQGVRTKDY